MDAFLKALLKELGKIAIREIGKIVNVVIKAAGRKIWEYCGSWFESKRATAGA